MTYVEGYMMTADLADGVLTLTGTNKASRLALDSQLAQRRDAAQAAHVEDRDVGALRADLKDASAREVPQIPVRDIKKLVFKEASRLLNGRMDVFAYGVRFQFHFRRKNSKEAYALYQEIVVSRG